MELTKISSVTNQVSSQLGALPPWAQEKAEKNAIRKAIQNDPRLVEIFGNAAITDDQIKKVDGGYVVTANHVEMRIDVKYVPSEEHFCGPAKFELVFHKPVPQD